MVGGNPQHDAFGFRNWNHPGAFHTYVADGSWGNFLGFFSTFVGAAYAYGGPDYLSLTAGEAKYPRRIFPNVFRRVIYREYFPKIEPNETIPSPSEHYTTVHFPFFVHEIFPTCRLLSYEFTNVPA
jgi:amino acid transporter